MKRRPTARSRMLRGASSCSHQRSWIKLMATPLMPPRRRPMPCPSRRCGWSTSSRSSACFSIGSDASAEFRWRWRRRRRRQACGYGVSDSAIGRGGAVRVRHLCAGGRAGRRDTVDDGPDPVAMSAEQLIAALKETTPDEEEEPEPAVELKPVSPDRAGCAELATGVGRSHAPTPHRDRNSCCISQVCCLASARRAPALPQGTVVGVGGRGAPAAASRAGERSCTRASADHHRARSGRDGGAGQWKGTIACASAERGNRVFRGPLALARAWRRALFHAVAGATEGYSARVHSCNAAVHIELCTGAR